MAEAYFLNMPNVPDDDKVYHDLQPAKTVSTSNQQSTASWSNPEEQHQSTSASSDVAYPSAEVANTMVANRSLLNPLSNGLIVEVEGFQMKNDFYVKEMAFVNPITKEYWVGVFYPPFDRQHMKKKYYQELDWATTNLHGLTWEEGLYPYSVAFTMLHHFGANFQLYAKGRQRCVWIQQHTCIPVVDLDDLGCPPLKELPFGCFCEFHNTLHKSCALNKATSLGQYLVNMFTMKTSYPKPEAPQEDAEEKE